MAAEDSAQVLVSFPDLPTRSRSEYGKSGDKTTQVLDSLSPSHPHACLFSAKLGKTGDETLANELEMCGVSLAIAKTANFHIALSYDPCPSLKWCGGRKIGCVFVWVCCVCVRMLVCMCTCVCVYVCCMKIELARCVFVCVRVLYEDRACQMCVCVCAYMYVCARMRA